MIVRNQQYEYFLGSTNSLNKEIQSLKKISLFTQAESEHRAFAPTGPLFFWAVGVSDSLF
jgi:hypothetical protein